jgi:dihydrofolate reductase
MGSVVVTEFVSLDGVFEDPGGSENYEHGGWTFRYDTGEEGGRFKVDEVRAADAQLLGRVTYEGFAAAWPSMKDDAGFADKFNSMPKYVVSGTLTDPGWNNSHVLPGSSLAEGVAALKERYPGDILVSGSGQLVRSLMAEGLVNEYRLMVFPVVLGSGKRLFADGTPTTNLALVSSRQVGPDGVTILTYHPAPSTVDT